jgi:hypothetical protein
MSEAKASDNQKERNIYEPEHLMELNIVAACDDDYAQHTCGCIGHYNQASLLSIANIALNVSKVFTIECIKRSIKLSGLYDFAQSGSQIVRSLKSKSIATRS